MLEPEMCVALDRRVNVAAMARISGSTSPRLTET
jgi:hypothetical protein